MPVVGKSTTRQRDLLNTSQVPLLFPTFLPLAAAGGNTLLERPLVSCSLVILMLKLLCVLIFILFCLFCFVFR